MTDCFSWEVVVAELLITLAGGLRIFARMELRGGHDVTNAAAEALAHFLACGDAA